MSKVSFQSRDRGYIALLTLGASPYREPDDSYRGSLESLAKNLAANVNNARGYEEECQRAEALAELDRTKKVFFPTRCRHQSEEALQQQRARFDLVASAAQVGFWFCDLPVEKPITNNHVKEHFWLSVSDDVTVEISDEGKGMKPERLERVQSRSPGIGISGMRERLRQFNGQMKIESGNWGPRVFVTIPIDEI